MFVKDRMSHPVITVTPDTPIMEAREIMRRERIRRLPVVDREGNLAGIITEKDILNASPSAATTLSIWEVNYLLSKVKVEEVMTREVITATEDMPLEEAARLIADHKVGALPVVRGRKVVGIITESDLFRVFLELMGARVPGVRLTVCVPDVPGQLAILSQAIADVAGNIVSVSTFEGEESGTKCIVMKVTGVEEEQVQKALAKVVPQILDVRTQP